MHQKSNEPPEPCNVYDFDLHMIRHSDHPMGSAWVTEYGVLAVARYVVCLAVLGPRLMVVRLVQLRMDSVSFPGVRSMFDRYHPAASA